MSTDQALPGRPRQSISPLSASKEREYMHQRTADLGAIKRALMGCDIHFAEGGLLLLPGYSRIQDGLDESDRADSK